MRALAHGELQGETLGRERNNLGTGWIDRRRRGHGFGPDWPRGQLRAAFVWARYRQGLDPCHEIRPRVSLSQELLDVGLALVLRGSQELSGSLASQMRREQDHAAEMQPSLHNGRVNGWELSCSPRGSDSLVRRVFRQTQFLEAVSEHRRGSCWQAQFASIAFANMRE